MPLRFIHLPMTRLLLAVASIAVFFLLPLPTVADMRFARLSEPGIVAVVRHAHAPGTGDPASFTLDDCATQRNLGAGQAAGAGDRRGDPRRRGDRRPRPHKSMVPLPRHGQAPRPRAG